MIAMTHRQRVITALDHQEPDRVPQDFGTGGNTSPVPELYSKIARLYGLEPTHQRVPGSLSLSVVDERILRDLDIDTRPVYMGTVRQGIRPSDQANCFYDDWGVQRVAKDIGGVIYNELGDHPLANATVESLDDYPGWPDPLDPERCAGLKEQTDHLYHDTDYALVGCPSMNMTWERAWYLCGFERLLVSLVNDLDFVHALLRRVTDLTKIALEQYLCVAGPYIQVIKMADDLGSQAGPLMSVKTYCNVVKPYHRELFSFIKKHTKAKIFLHTCGSVYKLLPELIEAGVEILNPVQVSAKDMDTRRLKAEFGDRLSFWGAIDTQHVLPNGSIDDVKREVERRIADLAPGGGYIIAPVHNAQADVPPENILTMYRHARQVGRYPLQIAID